MFWVVLKGSFMNGASVKILGDVSFGGSVPGCSMCQVIFEATFCVEKGGWITHTMIINDHNITNELGAYSIL